MTTKETQNSGIDQAAGKSEDFQGIFNTESLSSDSALTDPSLDRFGRSIFASKIAVAISQRKHKGSIAMGLYGAQGSGKTTLLNFIEAELSSAGKASCIRFNPDSCKNEAALIKAFFESLADASICSGDESAQHELAALLTDYSEILATGINPFIRNKAEEQVRENTQEYSVLKNLQVIKEKTEKIFGSAGRHIAILIDNMDLLNKSELKAVFRLIKLHANFSKTIYVLTFDQESAALKLGRGYDEAAADAGREFLEKLIQVPINIPPFEKDFTYKEAVKHPDKEAQSEAAEEISPDDLFSIIETADTEAIGEKVVQAAGSIGNDKLVNMLLDRSSEISEDGSINLISALGLKGSSFENPDSLFSFTTVFNHPGIVIHDLLEKITEKKRRFDTAAELLIKSEPVSFAFEAYRWMCSAGEAEEARLFDISEEEQLGRMLAERISYLNYEQPVYIKAPQDAPFLLDAWAYLAGREVTSNYLLRSFGVNKENIISFLKCYLPENSDVNAMNDIRIDQFNSIGKVIEHKDLFTSLLDSTGEEFLSETAGNKDLSTITAAKFARAYKNFVPVRIPQPAAPANKRNEVPAFENRRKFVQVKKGIYRPFSPDLE